jgi:hypothetical protein
LILACHPSKLGRSDRHSLEWKNGMRRAVIAAILLLGAMPAAQASPGTQGQACIAKVIKSVELPFGPLGHWKVQVTLQITPPGGVTYETTLQDNMPWQGPPPRRGQIFRLWCDPADPTNLHLI